MAIHATKFRLLVFFLMFFQVVAICYKSSLPSVIKAQQSMYAPLSADTASQEESVAKGVIHEVLYSPEKLLLSDALLSPIPTFQFGFIVIPACFLCVIFSFFTSINLKEQPFFFTNSYFHTLFLIVILTNAP